MVAKIILAVIGFWGFFGLSVWAFSKYAIPAYYEWKQNATKYDHKEEMAQMNNEDSNE